MQRLFAYINSDYITSAFNTAFLGVAVTEGLFAIVATCNDDDDDKHTCLVIYIGYVDNIAN